MKFILIPSLMAGLVSFGAMAQAPAAPATNPANGGNFKVQLDPPAPNMQLAPPNMQLAPTNKPAAPTNAVPAVAPEKGDLSYAVGVYYANTMRNDIMSKLGLDPKEDLDMGRFYAAYSNVVAGAAATMTSPDAIKVLMQQQAYEKEQVPAETNKLMALGPENKAKGEKFMDEMAGKPNVVRLADGVVYTVTKQGDGAKPTSNDLATLSFRATLIDGKEVWKVEHAGVPVSHKLLPPGVQEVLTQMKAGSHWMVYLPYSEAYGKDPALPDPRRGFKVGPYSAMIFDLELESFQSRPAPPAGPPPGMGGGQRPGGPLMMPPNTPVTPPGTGAPVTPPVTSSSIVRVPSAEEMANGEKPRVMTDAEVEAAKKAAATNAVVTNAAAPK